MGTQSLVQIDSLNHQKKHLSIRYRAAYCDDTPMCAVCFWRHDDKEYIIALRLINLLLIR